MKKLYALLVILIVIYIGINAGANNLNILSSSNNTTDTTDGSGVDGITVGASVFPTIDNFSDTKINDSAVKLVDNKKNVNILVEQINNSQNVVDIYNNLVANEELYTSSQVIDLNGVSVYFLYNEGPEHYDTTIFFNKNKQNYKISGYNTTYENSDYFINHCKGIINTINTTSNSGAKLTRF